ncbi:hypothetical protein H4Q26_014862 [Puccinia striiformis f. sp. tritici PST-130]|nr:hypothetical protein H4Q26_014862 [Puccinia striiformis f. sp. tritici PST-130]
MIPLITRVVQLEEGKVKQSSLQLNQRMVMQVSPAQKASTVKLVGEGRNAMTLAICDGANDAAMIQEAHIGVGIAGLEGAQALTSANYALGQCRF